MSTLRASLPLLLAWFHTRWALCPSSPQAVGELKLSGDGLRRLLKLAAASVDVRWKPSNSSASGVEPVSAVLFVCLLLIPLVWSLRAHCSSS